MPRTSSESNNTYKQLMELSHEGEIGFGDDLSDDFALLGFNSDALDINLESLLIQPLQLTRQKGKIFRSDSRSKMVPI